MQTVRVTTESGDEVIFAYGTRVSEIFTQSGNEDSGTTTAPIVAATVNNEVVSLSFKVEVNAQVLPIRLGTLDGSRIYRRSLCYLLTIASGKAFPNRRIVIGHSLGDSYYYYFDAIDDVAETDIDKLSTMMHSLAAADLPIERRVLSYSDALRYLQQVGRNSAMQLMQYRNESKVPIYECGNFCDISHGPLVPSTGYLSYFEIIRHRPGFLLRYPPADEIDRIEPFTEQPVVFSIFQEYKQWGSVLGISSAGQLNAAIQGGQIEEFIAVAEALHNKKIAMIADAIRDSQNRIKIALIAGPSSSGKTTFTKKLAIQLRVNGYEPIVISTDDYFLSREDTPRDETGEFDFESIEAIDRALLNDNLIDLLSKGESDLPVFDFKLGRRRDEYRRLEAGVRSIVLIEGIHGLNPDLTARIDKSQVFRVYISALTQLNIDDHNRIPTTDVRLLRRMVRDHQFRGYNAIDTIERWPSVRRGENNNIFPFEKHADIAFNSSLDYELPVLKVLAEPLLRSVKSYDESYRESIRLSRFLRNFIQLPATHVPPDSILREVVGNSVFRY